jgi:hypothetical protein
MIFKIENFENVNLSIVREEENFANLNIKYHDKWKRYFNYLLWFKKFSSLDVFTKDNIEYKIESNNCQSSVNLFL